jgi:hypothetical protein
MHVYFLLFFYVFFQKIKWWFNHNIPDSDVNEYLISNISNSGVGKYSIINNSN